MRLKTFLSAIAILVILLLPACERDRTEKTPKNEERQITVQTAEVKPGCRSCHPFSLDTAHAELTCSFCHNGDGQTADFGEAHVELISHPASPDHMQEKCGGCHQETSTVKTSLHYTLKNEVNLVRRHFGADRDLESLVDIPVSDLPDTALELADDLLRRRCLRCHVYYQGDEYSKIEHGTGCSACHLEYLDGKPVTHKFTALPTDDRCLSCHYGNRVGSDYYGWFDHDFKHEYRTPYLPEGNYPLRPYGLERHQLSPDIHSSAGMTCIDCHLTMHNGNTMQTISCAACHLNKNSSPPASNLEIKSGALFLITRQEGLKIPVPQAKDPAHDRYKGKVACTVCHAQWSYNDKGVHLIRIDHDDYDDWEDLFVQDSSEAEFILLNSIYGDEYLAPVMSDKISGRKKPGLWLKGFEVRRWADLIIDFDKNDVLQVMRPVLDIHLSWVDADGEIVFDSVGGNDTETMLPFTPHTIGEAGAYFYRRIKKLHPEKQDQISRKK